MDKYFDRDDVQFFKITATVGIAMGLFVGTLIL